MPDRGKQQAPAVSTVHPETKKPGKLGSPAPAGSTKSKGDKSPDARTAHDKDANAQQSTRTKH